MLKSLGFVTFGFSHLMMMCAIIFVSLIGVILGRSARDANARRIIAVFIAGFLLVNKLVVFFCACVTSGVLNSLPMHLCDWTGIAAIIALLWRKQLAFEMTYFWGLSGTLQAILTPDLPYDFPDLQFFTFFVSHGGVIVAIAFLTLGLQMRPWPWSLVRIFLWSNIYLGLALVVNFLLGTNYGYLCHKPVRPSLLDYLGPWPYYIGSLEGIALLSFVICYAPFFLWDRIAKSL